MKPEPPPPNPFSDPKRFARAVELSMDPVVASINQKYPPWRKARYLAVERGVDPVAAWSAVKVLRLAARRLITLKRAEGGDFSYCLLPSMMEQLHRIDQATGGGGAASLQHPDGRLSDSGVKARLAIRSLMDEAIDSSRIEGAVTTREQGLALLRSGRAPRTRHEQMVVNNYQAMQRIKECVRQDLSVEMLCELQAVLTAGTLDKPEQSGRFRRPEERVAVVDTRTDEPVFVPPPAETVSRRMKSLCEWANREHTGDDFLHPIVKANILHFMIGYEHPFADGNGRTARAAFYWHVLRSGYRVFEFLTISELILKAQAKYPQAYLDTEMDDGDLTYFVRYKLGVIERALQRLRDYLDEEESRIEESRRLIALDADLNLRQRLLLEHALRHPRAEYTVKSHANSNRITRVTARTDLEHLRRRKLVNTYKDGREVRYTLAPGVAERLGRM